MTDKYGVRMEATSGLLLDHEGDPDLTPLTIRVPKQTRAKLWQLKIFSRIKIEDFVRECVEEGFRKINL